MPKATVAWTVGLAREFLSDSTYFKVPATGCGCCCLLLVCCCWFPSPLTGASGANELTVPLMVHLDCILHRFMASSKFSTFFHAFAQSFRNTWIHTTPTAWITWHVLSVPRLAALTSALELTRARRSRFTLAPCRHRVTASPGTLEKGRIEAVAVGVEVTKKTKEMMKLRSKSLQHITHSLIGGSELGSRKKPFSSSFEPPHPPQGCSAVLRRASPFQGFRVSGFLEGRWSKKNKKTIPGPSQ